MSIHKLFKVIELKSGEKKCATVMGRKLVVVNIDNKFYALDNRCPHKGASLCDGQLRKDDKEIVCGLHGWDFELETGISKYNPDDPTDRVKTFKTKVEEGYVYVEMEEKDRFPQLKGYLEEHKRTHDDVDPSMEIVHKMSKGWLGQHGSTEAMGTEKAEHLWDKILFLPAQVAQSPLLDTEEVSLKTIIGKKSKHPLEIDMPVYISHMSFGALSREAKIALSKGSSKAGTMICSGEGGMLPEEFENACKYVIEVASGYFGYDEKNLKKADAIEIKMGQSAKAGMGGLLPAKKITDEIAKVRGLAKGQDAYSPSHIPDINSVGDLKKKVEELRKISGGKPVGIKFAASRVEVDLEAALSCNPDFITVDGRPGATGAAPKHIKDNICVPTLYALDRVMAYLKKNNHDLDVLVTGGFRLPEDFAKAIAMGATAVASANSALMAIGCQQYRACHTNKCPVGIATQDLYYRNRFDIEKSSARLFNFLDTTKYQLKDFARICGVDDIHKLQNNMIVTTDETIAKYTEVKHVGESYS